MTVERLDLLAGLRSASGPLGPAFSGCRRVGLWSQQEQLRLAHNESRMSRCWRVVVDRTGMGHTWWWAGSY